MLLLHRGLERQGRAAIVEVPFRPVKMPDVVPATEDSPPAVLVDLHPAQAFEVSVQQPGIGVRSPVTDAGPGDDSQLAHRGGRAPSS